MNNEYNFSQYYKNSKFSLHLSKSDPNNAKCFQMTKDQDLSKFKTCINKLQIIQNKKEDILHSYLVLIKQLRFNPANIPSDKNTVLQQKYTFPDHYYKTKEYDTMDMSVFNSGGGDLFSRNK